jgi:hypothetical protein
VHIHIGRYGGRLTRQGVLPLDAGTARSLAADFAEAFAAEGVELRVLTDSLLLLVPRLPTVETFDPENCLDEPLDACLPSGPGAARLRQLGTAIETWLHTLAVNAQRARLGQPPISTLWLWGCGAAPAPSATSASLAVYSRSSFLRGLGRATGAQTLSDEASTIDALVAEPADCVLAQAGTQLIAAAVSAVKAGRVVSLTVLTRSARFTLRRIDLLKFWRRAPRAAAIP